MKLGVLIFGYLSSFLLLLGTFFMNADLMAGKVLYLVGFFAFTLLYLLPLFLVLSKKFQENRIGVIFVSSILGMFLFLMGVFFYMVNWGGAMVLLYVGGGILVLAFLLMLVLHRRFYNTHIDAWFPILIFATFLISGLITSTIHKPVLRSFTISQHDNMQTLEMLQQRSAVLRNRLINCCVTDSATLAIVDEALYVSNEADCAIAYIDTLKKRIVAHLNGVAVEQEGRSQFNLVPIQSNVEINRMKRFMLGRKRHNAADLKAQIDSCRQNMLSAITIDDEWLRDFVAGQLSTDPISINKRFYNKTWEYQRFYNFPLVVNVCNLTEFQVRICQIQNEVLNAYLQIVVNKDK